MKDKQIKQRGEQVWLVDGKINGKRKRMFFESEAKAKDTTCQQWWLDLNNDERVDMMNAFMRSRDEGFTLLSAVDHFAAERVAARVFSGRCLLCQKPSATRERTGGTRAKPPSRRRPGSWGTRCFRA